MPQGNFARGLLPFLPGIAQMLSQDIQRGPEDARRKRLAAAFTPPDVNAQPPTMTDFGIPSGPQVEIPEATRQRQALGEQVRQPQTVNDLLASGYSPTDVLQVYKALPVDAQSNFQEIFNNEKVKYQTQGPDAVDPFMRGLIEKELAPKPFDPLTIGSPEEARIRGAQGMISPETLKAIEAAQPQSGLHRGEAAMSDEEWARAARIQHGLEPRADQPKPDKTPTPEAQFMADVKAILPQIEKEEVRKDAQGNETLYPLTFAERMQKAAVKADELRGLARNAGVVQGPPAPVAGAGLASPAAVPATPTRADSLAHPEWFAPAQAPDSTNIPSTPEEIQAAAAEMEADGISDIDITDPQFPEVYQRWEESQIANVR